MRVAHGGYRTYEWDHSAWISRSRAHLLMRRQLRRIVPLIAEQGHMRSILQHTSYAAAGADVGDLTLKSLAEYGWTRPDLGLERADLVKLSTAVISATEKANRDLPVSPESQFIQVAIDKAYGGQARGSAAAAAPATGPSSFVAFSFERHCLEQAILILCQIDRGERAEAFQREMTIIVGPEYAVYGIVFSEPAGPSSATTSSTYQVRLRCNDLNRLQTATTSFVSAMNPSKQQGTIRRFSSRSASVGRRTSSASLFQSDFNRVEIRSVANEKLFTGQVIPVTGRWSLLRQTLAGRSARVLLLLGALLLGLSAVLFALAPGEGWWMWTEQTMGRLATAAFGALLVDSAIDYSALRRSLMAGAGPVTHGAVINWLRAN